MKSITITKLGQKDIAKITSDEWEGELYQLSRATFVDRISDAIFGRPGVYVIYADHFDKEKYGSHIYIGQGDEVRTRLHQHTKQKPFWNKVLFFTSEWMNVAFAFNIENEFIQCAKTACRYKLDNGISGQSKQLGSEDLQKYERYVDAAKKVTYLANIDIFTANNDAVFSLKSDRFAKAVVRVLSWIPRKVTVSAGSKFPGRATDSEFSSLAELGIVAHSGHHWTFQSDVELEVKDGRIAGMPQLLGIYLIHFTNNCGVTLKKSFDAVQSGSIQRSPE